LEQETVNSNTGGKHVLIERIVRRTLGIKNHVVKGVMGEESGLVIELDVWKRRRLRCGMCGHRCRVRDRLPARPGKEREWKHAPLWGIPRKLRYRPARVRQSVAYGRAHQQLGSVLYIGIDELSRRKGHVYVTNVYDLREKRLIWSGEGRSRETLKAFFAEHGEALRDGIMGVCCDMWGPYIDVIKEELPHGTLVFDKFHIIQHLLQAVDAVRKEEARALKKSNPELLKRTRYLWLKNPENLTDKQRARLGYLEKLNLRCHWAYLLKETFREFWKYKTRGWARRFLRKWFWWATHSWLRPMRDFAWMLRLTRTTSSTTSPCPLILLRTL
jgi:hypothetical protein